MKRVLEILDLDEKLTRYWLTCNLSPQKRVELERYLEEILETQELAKNKDRVPVTRRGHPLDLLRDAFTMPFGSSLVGLAFVPSLPPALHWHQVSDPVSPYRVPPGSFRSFWISGRQTEC